MAFRVGNTPITSITNMDKFAVHSDKKWLVLPSYPLHKASLSKSKHKSASFQNRKFTTERTRITATLQTLLIINAEQVVCVCSLQRSGYKSINAVLSQQPVHLEKRLLACFRKDNILSAST